MSQPLLFPVDDDHDDEQVADTRPLKPKRKRTGAKRSRRRVSAVASQSQQLFAEFDQETSVPEPTTPTILPFAKSSEPVTPEPVPPVQKTRDSTSASTVAPTEASLVEVPALVPIETIPTQTSVPTAPAQAPGAQSRPRDTHVVDPVPVEIAPAESAPVVDGVVTNDLVSDIQNNLIRASAGTGKTYQLTSRYLRLLLLDVAPETILATTFTRKAAGEILDRIVTWLGQAATDAKELKNLAVAVELPELTHETCLAKLAVLTRQMHRLQIHTIDAFFMQMAKSFSLELGMTPGWQVLEEGGPESNSLQQEAIAGVLRQEALEDLLTLVHQLAPKGEAKRSLDFVLKSSVDRAYRLFLQSSPKAWDQLKVPPPLPDDELEEVQLALASFRDKRKGITQAMQADVDRILTRNWSGFFGGGKSLARHVNEGKLKYGNAKLTPELIELYERFLPHLRSMTLLSAQRQTLGTHRFLAKYHSEYRALKDGKRLYNFDEVTDLLAKQTQAGQLTQLAFRMDHGIDHLLLDEFQDTSIPQWRALANLAKRCTEKVEDGALHRPRSFFCVGDVKQAIYGWRGGSREIFDLLDKRLPNVVNSDLQESRRSSQVVIDAVNQVFNKLPGWDEAKLARSVRAAKAWDFPQHTTYHKKMPGYFAIETSGFVPSGSAKGKQEAAVFRRAAERVASISDQAKGRTIGILCRQNSKVGLMMNELQRLGVAASEEGGNYLTDSAAVELILSLLHLTDHPADSVAAYHLATSPWAESLGLQIGTTPEYDWDEDHPLKDDPGRPRPPAGMDPLAIAKLSRETRARLLHEGFGDTVHSWAMQLRSFCNRREARRLTQLVEKAYEYQRQIESPTQLGYELQRRQSMRPTEFVRYIRETKFGDPSNAVIRVMTVHQAKGLEFDVVILPDLLGPFIEGHETFLFGRPDVEADVELVCRYMGKDSGRSFLPKRFLPLFDDYEDRTATESFCVLYVALTRAAHALHVFLPSGMQKMQFSSKGHPGYLIKDAFMPGVALKPDQTMFEMGDRDWFSKCDAPEVKDEVESAVPKPRLARSTGRRRNMETVAPSQIGQSRYVRASERLATKQDDAQNRGTVIHRWLSKMDWLESVPSDKNLIKMAKEIVGADGDVDELLIRFKSMLESEELQDILDADRFLKDLATTMPSLPVDAKLEVRTEQRVAGRDGDKIVSGTIDRLVLVRNQEGKLLAAEVIDLKPIGLNPAVKRRIYDAIGTKCKSRPIDE